MDLRSEYCLSCRVVGFPHSLVTLLADLTMLSLVGITVEDLTMLPVKLVASLQMIVIIKRIGRILSIVLLVAQRSC